MVWQNHAGDNAKGPAVADMGDPLAQDCDVIDKQRRTLGGEADGKEDGGAPDPGSDIIRHVAIYHANG